MDQNWTPYFSSSNHLCSPVNPTLIKGQLYNSSRWWVSEYTYKNAPCSLTGNGQNCKAVHTSTSWRTTKQTYVRLMQWETGNHERKCGERIWAWKLQTILLRRRNYSSCTLCVIWPHRVGKERSVWACWCWGGAPPGGEDVYQSADSDPLCGEK